MLVARVQPTEISEVLELFQLALILVEEEDKERISQRMTNHFDTLLSQAKQIVADPQISCRDMMPQAVKFAFHLRWHPKLKELLSKIETLSDVDKNSAREILKNLEIS